MAIEVFEIATRIDLKSNAIKVIEDLAKQFEALDKLTKDVQSSLGRVAAELKRLGEGNTELKGLGRSVGSIAKAFDTVGKTSTEAAAGIEKIADSTRDAVSAGRRLGRIYTENADLARAAARATAGSGRSATEAAAVASRRSGASHGLGFGHGLMEAGIGAEMAGRPLLDHATEAIRQAMDTAHVMTILQADRRVGETGAAAAMQAAVQATRTAPGTTVTANAEALLDLKNVLGSLTEAQDVLPGFAKLTSILQVSDRRKGGKGDQAFAAAKAMDLLGELVDERTDDSGHVVREINPERVNRYLGAIARVNVATHGRVAPEDYLRFAKMGEVAGMQMSDQFLYEKLPAMIMAMGGSRVGTAFQSLNQVFQGDRITPKSYRAMEEIGLAGPGGMRVVRDPLTHRKRVEVNARAGVYDMDLMARDPLDYMEKAQRRMEGAGIHGTEAQIQALQRAAQRSTIARILAMMLKDMPGILREQSNIQNTTSGTALKSPEQSIFALQAAWKNLMQAMGSPALGDAISFLDKLTGYLHKLEDLARANPDWARRVVEGVEVAGAALVGAGGLTMALWALSGPVKMATTLIKGLGVAAEALGLIKLAGGAAGGGGIPPVAPIITKNPLRKSLTGLGLPLLDTPAAIALPLLAGGAAAGYMNAPMVDPITGAVLGNWGGAEGERNFAESQKRAIGQFKGSRSSVNLATPTDTPLHFGTPSLPGFNWDFSSWSKRSSGRNAADTRAAPSYEGGMLGGPIDKAASSLFSMPPAVRQLLGESSGRGAAEIGTEIGSKSAEAVKDRLDPHVIGTEIGNIAAATIRSAISSLQINVDGQQLGRVVDRHADQQALRPPTGPALPNVNLGPMFPAHAS